MSVISSQAFSAPSAMALPAASTDPAANFPTELAPSATADPYSPLLHSAPALSQSFAAERASSSSGRLVDLRADPVAGREGSDDPRRGRANTDDGRPGTQTLGGGATGEDGVGGSRSPTGHARRAGDRLEPEARCARHVACIAYTTGDIFLGHVLTLAI
jgi:hypothetical protein